MIDPGVILALLADLQAEVIALRQKVAELEATPTPRQPMVVPKEQG